MKTKLVIAVTAVLIQSGLVQSQTTTGASFLWKISGNGIQKPSYLYFTLATCDETIKFPSEVNAVLKDVNTIAVETNFQDKSIKERIQTEARAVNDSEKIDAVLSSEHYAQYLKKLRSGLPESVITQLGAFKPFGIYSFLNQTASPCEEGVSREKIEVVLKAYAKKKRKNFKEVFSLDAWIEKNRKYNNEHWNTTIMYALNNQDQITRTLQQYYEQYKTGKIDQLRQTIQSAPYFQLTPVSKEIKKEYVEKLTAAFENEIKLNSTFFQLGVENFLYDGYSILETLGKKGYTVEQLK
jgi:hypothetical protein